MHEIPNQVEDGKAATAPVNGNRKIDLDTAKQKAREAAAEHGHQLGRFHREETPERTYLIAHCNHDHCGCGMTVRLDGTFGGTAIKQDCGKPKAVPVVASPEPAEPTSTTVELASIRTDGGTQPRAELSEEKVAEYREAMDAGAKFPAVVVFYDGTTYWLADGFHRYRAMADRGVQRIEVDLRHGTQRDAILYSVGANAAHGLPRSNADKRRAVERLLADEEWSQWSEREIARRCAVSNRFVTTLRSELSVNGSQIAPPTRKATRNGKIYEMKLSRRQKKITEAKTPTEPKSISESSTSPPPAPAPAPSSSTSSSPSPPSSPSSPPAAPTTTKKNMGNIITYVLAALGVVKEWSEDIEQRVDEIAVPDRARVRAAVNEATKALSNIHLALLQAAAHSDEGHPAGISQPEDADAAGARRRRENGGQSCEA